MRGRERGQRTAQTLVGMGLRGTLGTMGVASAALLPDEERRWCRMPSMPRARSSAPPLLSRASTALLGGRGASFGGLPCPWVLGEVPVS